MKIDKIQKLKNGKYKLDLDSNEKVITYDDVILKNNLLYKKELTSKELNEISKDNSYYEIYNKTINYVTKRLRSEKEINIFLDKFNVEIDKKKKIIDELRKIGLVDNIKFTKAFISDRLYLSNDGLDKIRTSLYSYGIDDSIIESEINKIDQEVIREKINKLVSKKITGNHKYSLYLLKQKITSELLNLGYSMDIIIECLDQYNSTNSNVGKEYDKLYSKLSKKYEGNKLYYQIKQKLYQKGYSGEEIEKIIEKRAV